MSKSKVPPYKASWPEYFTFGASGPHVKWLQERLLEQGADGFYPGGNFLAKTSAALKYFQATHIGEDGTPLDVDNWFGPETLWALLNPSGEAQRSHIDTSRAIPDGLTKPRIALLETILADYASGEFIEVPDGSNKGPRISEFSRGAPWCAYYQSDAYKRTFGKYFLGRDHGHCMTIVREAKKAGCFYPKAMWEPIPGDFGLMSYGGGRGHIFAISRVDANGFRMNTFGGNEGNRLKHGARTENQATLLGYVAVFGESDLARKRLINHYERGVIAAGAGVDSIVGTR